ncbi:MAG: cupin domain-containing protein [Candidatus Eisenbacteria sp.]|nr:cupin domain-containing protein [Candidatus Eisenbacteria bacterium]
MAQTAGDHQDIEVSGPAPYARVYADSDGATHFSDETLSFQLVDYAPPAPPISVSEVFGAENVSFISSPAGWDGDWHPAPRRQFILVLVGELEVEVSDGEVRRFGPGSLCLVEDTAGKGHASRVVSSDRGLAAAIPLVGE